MEKTISQKIQLGLFVILGLLLFILAIYFIGDKQKMFGKTNHLIAIFNNVNGLQLGNNVRYSGINVGTVRNIEMINDTVIKIDMIIDESIFPHIKKNAVATISSDGLVGNMIINIIPRNSNASSVQPGDTIHSLNRVRTDDILSTLNVTNKNAALLTSDLLEITKKIKNGRGTFGLLLNDTIMSNDLKQTLKNLKITTQGTSESVKNLNLIISSLNKKENVLGVLNDSATATKMKKIVVNLHKTSNEIEKVVNNLNETILNAKDGNGTINYLSNDPNLVKKIDTTITNINEASKLLNQDLEALKHSFLLKGYFKKQEKEKKKK